MAKEKPVTQQHTPGPWEVQDTPDLDMPDVHAEGWPVTVPRENCAPAHRERSYQECLANARLIAAAPELLAACKILLGEWDDPDMEHMPGVKEARAAIAKAEGRIDA